MCSLFQTPFAVTSYKDKLFISDWDKNAIVSVTLGENTNGHVAETPLLHGSSPMGLFYSRKHINQTKGKYIGIKHHG